MGCCGLNNRVVSKQVTLLFKRSELLYDIANLGFIESHLLSDEQEHAKHVTADVAESGNVDRITRLLDLAHAQVLEMLYPYAKTAACSYEMVDNSLVDVPGYVVDLTMPSAFSHTGVYLLEKLIHEYMVCRAIYDWLSMTNLPAAAKWREKADEAEREIYSTKNLRMGGMTRPCAPF